MRSDWIRLIPIVCCLSFLTSGLALVLMSDFVGYLLFIVLVVAMLWVITWGDYP